MVLLRWYLLKWGGRRGRRAGSILPWSGFSPAERSGVWVLILTALRHRDRGTV
ncbi:hypothetical protein BC567DRAFT_238172 [Phyllosticta citribraziliensis]